MVEANDGAIDTLVTLGVADLTTIQESAMRGVQHIQEDASTAGYVVAHIVPGTLGYDGDHIALSDFLSPTAQSQLSALGFQSGVRVFGIDARADTLVTTEGGMDVYLPDLTQWYMLLLDQGANQTWLANQAMTVPGIDTASVITTADPMRTPNDPDWYNNWFLTPTGPGAIGAPTAWNDVTGSDSVVVGIVDTGVKYDLPDLDPGDRSRVLPGTDVADRDSDPRDVDGHGTGVASIAGAIGNNSLNLAGVLWRCKILPVKIQWDGATTAFDIAIGVGMRWAAENGANIVNVSFGSPPGESVTEAVLMALLKPGQGDPLVTGSWIAFARGASLFAAAGNDLSSHIDSPAYLPWVMAVGSSDGTGNRYVGVKGSDYGRDLDLLAPGVSGTALALAGGYQSFAGTSMASPVGAGVGGLVLSYAKQHGIAISNEDVYGIVEHSAVDLPPTGRDDNSGFGRVNATNAVALLKTPNTMLRGARTGGTTTAVGGLQWRSILGRLSPNIPAGQYRMQQYEVLQHITPCGPFATAPYVWGRELASRGLRVADPLPGLPWDEAVNVTPSGFDIRTYVYHLVANIYDGMDEWVPCRPENATMSYTAIGDIPLHSAVITSPTMPPYIGFSNTWGANVCGSEAMTYEWRSRPTGGAWSSVLGAGPTYTEIVPAGQRELQLTVVSGSDTVQTIINASGVYYTISVDQDAVPQVQLAATTNPARGGGSGRMGIKRDGWVGLDVFDVGGRRVRSLQAGTMKAGRYAWAWDGGREGGGRAGSGVYFVRLQNAGVTRVLRLVVLE